MRGAVGVIEGAEHKRYEQEEGEGERGEEAKKMEAYYSNLKILQY